MNTRATSHTRRESDDVIGYKQENECGAGSEVWGHAHTHTHLNAEIQPSLFNLVWFLSGWAVCDFDQRVWSYRSAIDAGSEDKQHWNLVIIHQPGELSRFQLLTLREGPMCGG